LQLAMDAPILLKLTKEEEEELNYDTLKTAEKELSGGVLPITVRRPLPKKSGKSIKKLTDEEIKERLEKQAQEEKKEVDEEKVEGEETVEGEDGEASEKPATATDESGDEIMEMATPEDEVSEDDGEEAGEEF
jgi:hypothetical protein